MFRSRIAFTILLALVSFQPAGAEPISFEQTVRPILKQYCWHCHGEEPKLEGGFDARLAKYLIRGGESGFAIERGKHQESLLYQRIANQEMPPNDKKLSADQLEKIALWIDQGALTTATEPDSLSIGDVILDSDRQHWAFQPIQRPALPKISNVDSVRTPIDIFLLSKLETKGLEYSDEADRVTLLRRLSFDFIGLPPDTESIECVLTDSSDDWYEKQVDRMLASPAYGERWGRHWLDVVGYADSNGYTEKDVERKWSWRYRDYVIRSFNSDKPWDQMIVEQLAGDELVGQPFDNLDEKDVDRLEATGFLRMVPDGTADGSTDAKIASNEVIAETIKVVSSSLLGLTVGCAQCHSHRYDPISQNDYYRFRALFEPAYNWKAWKSPEKRLVSLWTQAIREMAKDVENELKEVSTLRKAELDALVQETFERELVTLPEEIQTEARNARETPEKERTAEHKELIKKYPFLNVSQSSVYLYLPDRLKDFNKRWGEATDVVRKRRPTDDFVDCLSEPAVAQSKPPETFVFYRGDHNAPRNAVNPGELSVLLREPNPVSSLNQETSTTGRRLSYAKHLTNGRHPLVARVLVNRFWMHHFGQGLVTTTTDFGMLGKRPSHPELLDWLADEFMRRDWSLKELHRLIVTSAAYRQSSKRRSELEAVDPDNEWLGRMPLRRLESEVVRDSILDASGRLSLKRFGIPVSVSPDEVGQIVIGADSRDSAGRPTGKKMELGENEFRRSLYVQVRRSMPLGVLEPFDNPIMFPNCGQRACSTVAPQSLLLMNSQFVAENAEAFAARVERETSSKDLQAIIQHAWLYAFGRKPTTRQRERAVAFLKSDMTESDDGDEISHRKLVHFCHALFCSNPFLYVE